MSPELRWYPIVMFLQTAFDLPMATAVPTGYGHNYAPESYIDAWVAVIAILALGLSGTLKWEDIEKKTGWGILLLFGGGMTAYNEPHYSLRDGCNMKNVPMADGSGNRTDSYAHCKDLPRVYSGKAWVPVTSKPNPPRA